MTKSSIPIIIQATNRSLVFEGKVLARLTEDSTVLAYLIRRLQQFWDGPLLLATSANQIDVSLAQEAARLGIECFRGDQENLISRLYQAAQKLRCDRFVRVYGSYPLADLHSLHILVKEHLSYGGDYSYNEHRYGVPWGMGCEVIETNTIKKLLGLDLTPEQKEAGTLYIRQNPDLFNIHRADSPLRRPNIKIALEFEKDLFLLRDIVQHVPEPDISTVIAYLDAHPILAQSNQESPPKEVGIEKLYLHTSKIDALLDNRNSPIDISYPISVELSLTNRCNLNCIWCSDHALRKREGFNNDLDLNTLYRLFDDLKAGGVKGVVLEGGGEPTLHKEFEQIVQNALKINLPIGLITNGTATLSAEILSTFEWIRVSLDASNPDEFRTLKGWDGFESVLSNIYRYAEGCPTVGVGYVVTNRNIYDIETLVLRLRRYGVSYIQFRPVIDSPDLYPGDSDLGYLQRYQTEYFSIIIDGMQENTQRGNSGLPCKAHSLTTVISAEGNVFLCGRLNIYDWLPPLGNIRQQTFREIWLGEERQRQALQVLDGSFCQSYCPQCRVSKFNELFRRIERTKSPHFI